MNRGCALAVASAVIALGDASVALAQEETLRLGLFGDTNLKVSDDPATPPAASLGQLALHATSNPTPLVQLLAEVAFELDDQNHAGVDIERLQARFAIDDRLAVTLGRVHQSLGYYNTAYHHGAILQTASRRPIAVAFEDDGGLLPVHVTGLELTGEFPLGTNFLGYAFDTGNGRGRFPDEVMTISDHNRSKSLNFQLYLDVRRLGLRVGGNALFDWIPEYVDPADPTVLIHPAMTEHIFGLHLVFDLANVLLLAEAYRIAHAGPGLPDARTFTGFVEASYRLARFRPYLRFEWVDYPATGDLFYSTGPLLDRREWIVGLRFDLDIHLALKLEYDRLDLDGVPGINGGVLQAAFAF